jgi:spermidine/putrescine transport system substrate-binding protein
VPSRLSRRAFLARGAGATITASGLGPLLAACDSGAFAASPPGGHQVLPGPKSPVTWPIRASNPAIASGLLPERNATLKVYCWVDRVNPQCLSDFAKAYKCHVELTTFDTFEHAWAELIRGRTFDVVMGVPSYVVGRMVWKDLLQPLNHSYIRNISKAWPIFANPYYDSGWRYTVPYTVFSTGIAWRKDLVDLDPFSLVTGWNFPWDAAAAGGKAGKTRIGILNDYRSSIGLGLLKNFITDLSTTNPLQIDTAQSSLLDLQRLADVQIGNNTSREIATGRTPIHLAWSGQVAAAAHYLPKGVSDSALGYWFPPDGRGPVGNDTNTVHRGASNPVLAHLFLNFMLDGRNALINTSRIGYTQPLKIVTPRRLVYEGFMPRSLVTTVVLPTYVDHGLKELQLPVAGNALWAQAWAAVTHHYL